jgi:hypothetical protein
MAVGDQRPIIVPFACVSFARKAGACREAREARAPLHRATPAQITIVGQEYLHDRPHQAGENTRRTRRESKNSAIRPKSIASDLI